MASRNALATIRIDGPLTAQGSDILETLVMNTSGTVDFSGTSTLSMLGDLGIDDGTTTLGSDVTVDVGGQINLGGGSRRPAVGQLLRSAGAPSR